jgi:uncharacterized protein
MRLPIPLDREKIADFCRRWKIKEYSLFGSVLREDFRPDSDVDVLVSFAEDAPWSFFDMVTMQEELKAVLGREVDLVERRAVERSENYIRRRHILQSLEQVYVAGWGVTTGHAPGVPKNPKYTQEFDFAGFENDEVMQDAVMRRILIIGEAARKVSPEFKEDHPEFPWSMIIGMRNRLIHEYFRVITEKVWEVVEKDIPVLIALLEPLVPPE